MLTSCSTTRSLNRINAKPFDMPAPSQGEININLSSSPQPCVIFLGVWKIQTTLDELLMGGWVIGINDHLKIFFDLTLSCFCWEAKYHMVLNKLVFIFWTFLPYVLKSTFGLDAFSEAVPKINLLPEKITFLVSAHEFNSTLRNPSICSTSNNSFLFTTHCFKCLDHSCMKSERKCEIMCEISFNLKVT